MDKKPDIITIVERRRRWGREEKLAILSEAFEPGASVAAVADRNGVSRSLLYNWLRRVREGRMPGVSINGVPGPGFVPVRIGEGASAQPVPPASPQTARPAQAQAQIVEIVLANGRVLRVEDRIKPATLARFVAALDGPAKS